MTEEILVCLDGSPLAETILPLAQSIATAKRGGLSLLRVVEDAEELFAEERDLHARARGLGAQIQFVVSPDPASAILGELEKNPRAIPAMTTHGRTAWSEAILGSVAFQVIRGAKRPVILYCPLVKGAKVPKKVSTLAIALDGNDFAEKILPSAAAMAKSLAARLLLIQALPTRPPLEAAPYHQKGDIIESSYLHAKANEVKKTYAVDVDWEVLHGDPADAICGYVKDMPETMLAITTHARRHLERAILGSVAGTCVRRAGVPILIDCPVKN
jgi:nucleotide-binding universal stress UspA family protein